MSNSSWIEGGSMLINSWFSDYPNTECEKSVKRIFNK